MTSSRGNSGGSPYLNSAPAQYGYKSNTVAGSPVGIGQICCYDDVAQALTQSSKELHPADDHNEVYAGIVIGNGLYARDLGTLRRDGITHVLNAGKGSRLYVDMELSPSYYQRANIEYMAVDIFDDKNFDLKPHFEPCSAFIDAACQSNGKVLVHCMHEISRSGTLVLAYLILKKDMSLTQAIYEVRKKRPIMPNPGFIDQLIQLNNEHFSKLKDGKVSPNVSPMFGNRFR